MDNDIIVEPEPVDPVLNEVKEARKDTQACLDALKELTKIVGEMAKESEKWRKAGKF